MIIISQDEKAIHNFDNIISIQVEEGNGNYKIIVYDEINDNTSLGSYKTEERAKEVLGNVIICYANIELIKIPKMEIQKKITSTELLRNICYKMPEE